MIRTEMLALSARLCSVSIAFFYSCRTPVGSRRPGKEFSVLTFNLVASSAHISSIARFPTVGHSFLFWTWIFIGVINAVFSLHCKAAWHVVSGIIIKVDHWHVVIVEDADMSVRTDLAWLKNQCPLCQRDIGFLDLCVSWCWLTSDGHSRGDRS